jgi:hypothetical protein
VKVVGGFEIYSFRIQHLVHFYTRFWRYLISNMGPSKRFGPGRRRAPPKAARRLRLALPHTPRPEAVGILSAHACHGPRRTGSVRSADRQFVGGAPPYAHRSRPGTTVASPRSCCRHPGRAALINVARSPLLTPVLPLHRAAAVELCSLLRPTTGQPPIPLS